MKIRLEGTKGECGVAALRIAEVLSVFEVSEPYANRGPSQLVRVYMDVRIPGAQPQPAADTPLPLRRPGRISRRQIRPPSATD
jgi:hypothetical protein